jgi:hypothetical protein
VRAKISTILRWLLETTTAKSRRSSSQKEVTHQIVKEQDSILAMSRSKASPRTDSRKLFAQADQPAGRPIRARGNSYQANHEGKTRVKNTAKTASPSTAGNRRFMGDS